MAGISSRAMGKLENRIKYNGNELQLKEFTDGGSLELYDFNARTYDQQIGRFIQIDPLTEEGGQDGWSPYHYSYNNPFTFSDPDGKLPIIPVIFMVIGLVTAAQPAVAPTGNASDGPAIRQAQKDYNTSLGLSLTPVPKEARVSSSLFGKSKELVKGKLYQDAGKVLSKEIQEEIVSEGSSVKVPNPDGKNGGKQHREKINEAQDMLVSDGYNNIEREVMVRTPNGNKSKRFVDIQGKNSNGEVRWIQVGKQNKNGSPVSREVKAMNDLRSLSLPNVIEFLPYNK